MKIKEKNVSLSQKAKAKILDFINKSGLQPNELLPSEANLMKMLGVSRYTVREALALLEQERIVYKIQGKGTYLNKRPLQIESGLERLESVTLTIEKFGHEPGTKWIGIEIKTPTEEMIEKLGIPRDEKVVTFKRLRTANGNVAAYCVDSMPISYFKSIPYDIKDQSMFSYLENEFGIFVESAVSYILPTTPTQEMIEELGVSEESMYILLHQIHYDREGRAVLYSLDYFNPEVFKFKINRTR